MKFLIFLGLLPLILSLDSRYVAGHFEYGQWVANLATLAYFFLIYRQSGSRLKRLMLIGLAVSTLGEVCFSLIIKMYEYRLHTIPLYVPLGHTILYAQVYRLVRRRRVLRRAALFKSGMAAVATIFSFSWLVFNRDVYGFICFGVFGLMLWFYPHSRLFFLTMFLMVAYLELLGTSFGCWYWPPYLLNRWPELSSANPPSSISVFYMAFDVTCLKVYLRLKQPLRRRYKNIRRARRFKIKPAS